MCVSSDDNKTCAFSGLPLVQQNNLGVFCEKLCGYKEAWIFNQLSLSNNLGEPRKSTDELPLTNNVTDKSSSVASRYIDAVHDWIDRLVKSNTNNR